MRGKSPTATLVEEHRIIQRALTAMAVLADRLASGQGVETGAIQEMVEFMRTFADRCHHGKEEAHLYSMLERRGVALYGSPLDTLNEEHRRGRALVAKLAGAADAYLKGDSAARGSLVESLRGLVELYPVHIWREEYLLFPMTDATLTTVEQEEMYARFDAVEVAIGKDVRQRYEQLADKLARASLQ